MKTLEYTIITSATVDGLQTAVENLIKWDWRPVGGVAVTIHEGPQGRETKYLQAMTRKNPTVL